MAHRRNARAQRRQARHPAPAAARGLGSAIREGDELPSGLPRPDPRQARTRSSPAPLLHHRSAHGIPLRAQCEGDLTDLPESHDDAALDAAERVEQESERLAEYLTQDPELREE